MSDQRMAGPNVRTGLLYEYDAQGGGLDPDARWRDLIITRTYTRAHVAPEFRPGTALSCDSPYGYVHGQASDDNGRSFIVIAPLELSDIRGRSIEINDEGQWRVTDWYTLSGAPMPPLVVYPPPQAPPLPPTAVAGLAAVAAAQTQRIAFPGVAAPTVAGTVQAPKIVVARKTILEQAMDEGYNPLCKDSPTGLQRPKIESATQVFAYLQSCAVVDTDLAVNELNTLMNNPFGFFSTRWPDYEKELSGDLSKVLTKVG